MATRTTNAKFPVVKRMPAGGVRVTRPAPTRTPPIVVTRPVIPGLPPTVPSGAQPTGPGSDRIPPVVSPAPPPGGGGGGGGGGAPNTTSNALMPANLKGAMEGTINSMNDSQWANRNYDVDPTKTYGRTAQEQEMSAYQLEKMLASDSPLMRRAAASAMAGAGTRGLMNSSIAQGNAMGAMIDRATPLALQDAEAHGRAASETLAGRNAGGLMDTQAGVAAMQAGAQRDRDMLGLEGAGWSDIRRGMLDINAREDTQNWQTGERVGTQKWQTGERLGAEAFQGAQNDAQRAWGTSERQGNEAFQSSQNELNRIWTSGENEGNRTRDWAVAQLNASTQHGLSREQSAMQILSSIYSNPEMTAAQQKAAAGEAMKIIRNEFGGEWADNFIASAPPWLKENYGEPGSSSPPAGATPPPPGQAPPPGDSSTAPPGWDQGAWDSLPPSVRDAISHGIWGGIGGWGQSYSQPKIDPNVAAANAAAGQIHTSQVNSRAARDTAGLPPII